MDGIRIIKEPTTRAKLSEIAKERFGDLIKAAVDIENEIIAVGGEFHRDEMTALYEECGSKQQNVWGINIYPDNAAEDFIEFDSLINLKPEQDNRSRGIENEDIKTKITLIVKKLVL